MKMNKIIIGGIVTLIIACVLAATGWNFKATAEMTEKFLLKSDHEIFVKRNDRSLETINNKLDKIYDHLIEEDN